MKQRSIKKIFIANRGEIAVRIQRAAQEMGIMTVVGFSDTDRSAPFVLHADEAYPLEGILPKDTYLDPEKLILIAKNSHCDAVHPGYGFLSENYHFAEAVETGGLIFIGPPASAIKNMGGKISARKIMKEAGVPIVPGTTSSVENVAAAAKTAKGIGYPVLVKASGGGGGKGMRVVSAEKDLVKALEMAKAEAGKAFGDSEVYIEKFLEDPRHIEIQIIADRYGNVIHVGERECSIQRRHQKVIEETPSTAIDPVLRARMGQTAVEAARACGYVNAGTVEFLLDAKKNFFFLEMNTRVQVEHSITELTYGIDIVKEQIKIASGEHLSFQQNDLQSKGHAIECRLYAEEPENNFLPSTGTITSYLPSEGIGIRNDSGIRTGSVISHVYDPLLAKLSVWGLTREEAIQRMKRALAEYVIQGVETTIPFCDFVINHPAFVSGNYNINFVQNFFNPAKLEYHAKDEELIASLVFALSRSGSNMKLKQDHKTRKSMKNKWLLKRFQDT
jgi:acetyl-CoA carboxylase, biotin carboxylase subunit